MMLTSLANYVFGRHPFVFILASHQTKEEAS